MDTQTATELHKDWHPADVIAALRKRHTSLRQLAMQNDYSHIQRVLTSPWLAAEQIVAKALGMKPEEIWPSRYVDPASRMRAFHMTRRVKPAKPVKPRARAAHKSEGARA